MLAEISEWFDSTHLHEQIVEVDYAGLFSNPWFMVPFVSIVLYMLYKQNWKDIFLMGMLIAVWWVSGTDYMHSLIVDGELQMDKILPVAFGGAAALGLVIYILFGRSD
jgi:hypothetical protein